LGGLAAVALVGCESKDGKVNKTPTPPQTPKATETIAPTPTVEPTAEPTPTPEPTQFVPKKLADAEFVPTEFAQIVESVDSVYRDHPEISKILFLGSSEIKRNTYDVNLEVCRKGDPTAPLYPKTLETDRVYACASMTEWLYFYYEKTGHEDIYQAAVNVTNYLLTELPERKAQLDSSLEIIGQTSPDPQK